MTLVWPNGSTTIPRVTSEFNLRRKHPITGKIQPHRGIDLAGWHQLVAPAAGVVTRVGWQAAGAGHYVNITADGGVIFKFFHLATKSTLTVGQRVAAGTVVGRMGMTGSATGVHVHFEVWVNGASVDPREYYATHISGDEIMATANEVAAAVWLIKHNELDGGNARDWLATIPMKTWLVRHDILGNRTGHEALLTIEGKIDGLIEAVKAIDGVDPEMVERVVRESVAAALATAAATIAGSK